MPSTLGKRTGGELVIAREEHDVLNSLAPQERHDIARGLARLVGDADDADHLLVDGDDSRGAPL